MDFPHLNDTAYPNLDNVDVYAHQVVFDYKRWVPNTKLYLCNVRWNGDYEDVVKFDSDSARDAWFDELVSKTVTDNPGCATTLKIATNVVQNQVKVPMPYDVATQYNYLVVDVPVMTSDDAMIPYETKDGYRRWHFFIDNFNATAPNTTRLDIQLDFWTQYINSVGFNYFLLERGHAPVKATDTDKYLANPIENNDLLLAPDVNYGNDTNAQGSKFIPFGNGEKYICFASTCTPSQLSAIGNVQTGASYSFTDPVFSDEAGYPNDAMRWGRQYHVDGYGFGTGKSYANVTTPTGNNLSTDGRIPNNVTVYAVKATEANEFVNGVMNTSPTFLKTIVACFMVAKELVNLGTAHTLAGRTMYECTGSDAKLCDVKLTKDMFNIPAQYQKYAKLYTYPYSELEVTDNNGKTVTVRVEQTGAISAHGIVSVAYPYLNMRVFLTGIAGVGSNSYQWQDLRGSHDCEISNSDWYRFCYDMDVPMYSLYMDGQTSWEITNYNRSISNARNSALINYHNSVRQANNAMNNSKDASETNHTNSVNSANVAQSNTNNAANTQHTNTYNDATCTDNNNANVRSRDTDVTNTNNAATFWNMNAKNNLDSALNLNENGRMDSQTIQANSLTSQTTTAENNVTAATANNNGLAAMATSVAQLGAALLTPGPNAIGQGASAIGTIANGVAQYYNAQATINGNTATAGLQVSANTNNNATSQAHNQTSVTRTNEYNTDVARKSEEVANANTNRGNECNKANTDNTTSTMRTNADNTQAMLTTNAKNTRDMSVGNADRLNDTTQANANWTDLAAIASAQDILRNTQNETRANASDAANANPVRLCPTSGDATADYMRTRGIQLKVRTQSRNAIRATGDEFVRYGYALNQIWEIDSLCVMKHFSYWKAKDCWVYDVCETSDLAQVIIANIFKQGVTVWSDPAEIGRVNPYDN